MNDNRHLFKACQQGSVDELKELVTAGAEVDAKNMTGYRSTHLAALNGHTDCLSYLLDLPDVDPDWRSFEDVTALMLASMHGHTECLECLLQKKADPNICNNMLESPLLKAVQNGHLLAVELLLKNHADPNKRQISGCGPLHSAVYGHNVTLVKLLLENGADVGSTEECNLTPIFIASQFGFLDCLRVLLEECEKENRMDLVNTSAEDGATPLYLAAQNGHSECVDLLLQKGANPDKVSDCPRAVALYAALQFNRFDCVQLLLPKTDSKVYASCDSTPFEMAASASMDNEEILQFVVDNIQNYHIDTLQCMESFTYRLFPIFEYPVNSITATASMILSGYHSRLIGIMLKAGASPDSSHPGAVVELQNARAVPDLLPGEHQLFNSLPPIIADCENEETEILELLLQSGANPNIYSPSIDYNLTIFFSLSSREKLSLLLRSGAETTSCFHTNHSSLKKYSGFSSSSNENGNTCMLPASFTKVLFHFKALYPHGVGPMLEELVKLLLEFTISPGYLSEVIDLLTPGSDKEDIIRIMSTPSSLAHSCRVKIREYLTFKNLKRDVLLSVLNLPGVVCDFIMYAGNFDIITE